MNIFRPRKGSRQKIETHVIAKAVAAIKCTVSALRKEKAVLRSVHVKIVKICLSIKATIIKYQI